MNDSIVKFNHMAGLVLADRLTCFPRKDGFSPESLLGVERFDRTVEKGKYTHLYLKNGVEVNMKEDFEFLNYVIDWLLDHGYLSGSIYRGVFVSHSFTLSPAALVLLNSTPKLLEGSERGESYGSILMSAIKEKTASEVSSIVLQYITDSIAYAGNFIGTGIEKMIGN